MLRPDARSPPLPHQPLRRARSTQSVGGSSLGASDPAPLLGAPGGAPVAAFRAGCPRSRAAGCRRAGRQPRIAAARRRGRGCAASALPGSREVASARVLMLLHRRIQHLPRSQIGRLGARHSGCALRSCSSGARPTRAGAHLHSAAAPGGSVLPGAQDLSRRAACCAPACQPGSPLADRETQEGGAPMAGCVCANAVVDATWDAPWIDAMVFGQCPAPSQAL